MKEICMNFDLCRCIRDLCQAVVHKWGKIHKIWFVACVCFTNAGLFFAVQFDSNAILLFAYAHDRHEKSSWCDWISGIVAFYYAIEMTSKMELYIWNVVMMKPEMNSYIVIGQQMQTKFTSTIRSVENITSHAMTAIEIANEMKKCNKQNKISNSCGH